MPKQKVDASIETIFSHAVALDQAGRLRNTIFVDGSEVYVLNQDHTVLLRFALPSSKAFKSPISFKACDYDSPMFSDREGLIVFEKRSGDLVREKSCSTPGMAPAEVREIFQNFPPLKENRVRLDKKVLSLLEEELSHVEISGEDGALKIVQRNIYDGTLIEITRDGAEGFGIDAADKISSDFGPLGLRTNDFAALFLFNDQLTFSFPEGTKGDYARVQGRNFKMSGIIALCLYDELGDISHHQDLKMKEKKDGRQEQKKRSSEQESGGPDKTRKRRGRRGNARK